ncbi:trimeric intracellular cation channel family protein [Demequina lignilytica]|uniref:TRIC cation channel family protein n=1 Tax=Demequina lignilytica TaxID=3051663 RepID=A0AB35MFM1_9MICO|nr:TRIC cation channel family protein [Demequina sp. SYSU T0a273]MDN4482577.1 TRIC cation channel family protein [Demequina sp. SYSU T0a273]
MIVAADLIDMPQWIYVAAVFIGALGGAIRAGEDEHTDLVGVLTLSAAMGFGGAIIRDILLGRLPPQSLRDPSYFIAAGAAAGVGMLFLYYLRKLGRLLWWLDSIIIGVFAVVGVNTALLAGVRWLPAVVIGTIASVGGLMLCDVLQGRPSSIMYMGPPNAIAGLGAGITYVLLARPTEPIVTLVISTAVAVLIRLSGPLLHVSVPQPRKHAYELKMRRAFRRARKDGTLPEGVGDLSPATGSLAAVTLAHPQPQVAQEPAAWEEAEEPLDSGPPTETLIIDEYAPGLGHASPSEEWAASVEADEPGPEDKPGA